MSNNLSYILLHIGNIVLREKLSLQKGKYNCDPGYKHEGQNIKATNVF